MAWRRDGGNREGGKGRMWKKATTSERQSLAVRQSASSFQYHCFSCRPRGPAEWRSRADRRFRSSASFLPLHRFNQLAATPRVANATPQATPRFPPTPRPHRPPLEQTPPHHLSSEMPSLVAWSAAAASTVISKVFTLPLALLQLFLPFPLVFQRSSNLPPLSASI